MDNILRRTLYLLFDFTQISETLSSQDNLKEYVNSRLHVYFLTSEYKPTVFINDGCLEHIILRSKGNVKLLHNLLQQVFLQATILPVTLDQVNNDTYT